MNFPHKSGHVLDTDSLTRAINIANESARVERQDAMVADATQKDADVISATDGDIDMTDAVAQAGRQLSRSIIETRLKSLNPNLRFERSLNDPNKQGIYLHSTFLCGMEWERSPEFTVNFVGTDHSTGKQQLLNQVRGWRSVLDYLIRKQIIPAEATYRLFEVWKGRESARWSMLHN